jgi:hypothetical protein
LPADLPGQGGAWAICPSEIIPFRSFRFRAGLRQAEVVAVNTGQTNMVSAKYGVLGFLRVAINQSGWGGETCNGS